MTEKENAMTEKEKMINGMLYNACDPVLAADRTTCKELCFDFNSTRPKDVGLRNTLLHKILGNIKGKIIVEPPFYCDYGYNIRVGENFFSNHNLVVLDCAPVTFGDNVFIAPNCGFYTAGHPLDTEERNKGLEYARAIKVGNNVWIGGNVCVLPGVTIGDNCVIGAGSVVVRDIPSNSLAVGNPCRVIRNISNSNKDMNKYSLGALLVGVSGAIASNAQTLEKMNWFNEPEQWSIEGGELSMFVTPQSDYWRISHYGFTVDDAPFYYAEYGGEFEAKVKITGDYKVRFDQAGMMIRIDHENYIKTGIEYVDGKYNLSTVVTHHTSDWSVIALDRPVKELWIKAVRRLDAVEIFYSFDDKEYTLMRNAWLEANRPVKVGMMAASPDGKGFKATFSDFSVKHLPDKVRSEWLKNNAE